MSVDILQGAGEQATHLGRRWIPPLPESLGIVLAPELFSPSSLGSAEECLLKAVLSAAKSTERLKAGPAADRGQAFHLLLERAIRGEIERHAEPELDARRELDTILEEANVRFAARLPPGIGADLHKVWKPAEMRRKVRMVIDIAVRYLDRNTSIVGSVSHNAGAVTAGTQSKSVARDFGTLPTMGTWAEVRMGASHLRLNGRADIVEKSYQGVTIKDLKTGHATDDGEVQPQIVRQLRLYGLIAQAYSPQVPLRLVVDDGIEREVAFGPVEADETRVWLQSITSSMPAGEPISVQDIATVGAGCALCNFRHVCPSYRSAAIVAWKAGAPFRLPLDIWGRIEALETFTTGSVRARIRDAAGRLVSVSGIHPARLEGLKTGDSYHLFGLSSRDRTGSHERWRHPLNFFESVSDAPTERAWSLQTFRSD